MSHARLNTSAIAPQMLRATCAQPPVSVSVSSFPSSPFGLRTVPLKKMGATPLTISQMGIIAYADGPDDKFSYESKLLEKVIRMEIKMSQLEQVLVQTGTKFENLLMNVTMTLENKTAELDVLKDHMDLPLVAFHAYDPVDSSLDASQILILSTVIMNEGDGYDNVIGTFRAPVAGLYYFAAHVCNYATRGFYYEIVKDHVMIAKSVKYNNVQSDCGSVNVITKMERDERVWITCTSGNTSPQLYSSSINSAEKLDLV
ncbi:hypothetical protein MAR_016066 [Mya arenaria]|uniref:C1q domain-containing protein n=1 Tax=Mya arenaria TaxID=6604 RepID=A0ABY7FM18_MYAAR|nr:hypothetical protein MAR_016066 [Mya arenaria]